MKGQAPDCPPSRRFGGTHTIQEPSFIAHNRLLDLRRRSPGHESRHPVTTRSTNTRHAVSSWPAYSRALVPSRPPLTDVARDLNDLVSATRPRVC